MTIPANVLTRVVVGAILISAVVFVLVVSAVLGLGLCTSYCAELARPR